MAVRTGTDHPVVITLISHAIGLAPGTMVVDVATAPTTLFVHVLHLREVEDVRAEVARLERLAARAVGHGRPGWIIVNNKAEGSAPRSIERLAGAVAETLGEADFSPG